jgi:hypothetical protein
MASLTKRGSAKVAAKKNLAKPGGKVLWFSAGTYLTVRNEEGWCIIVLFSSLKNDNIFNERQIRLYKIFIYALF